VLGAVVHAFASLERIGPIVIAVPPGDEHGKAASFLPPEILERENLFFVSGGESRRVSVHRALLFLENAAADYVLIHDGARPWVGPELIGAIIDAAVRWGAAVPVLPALETPKELDGSGFIRRHPKRADMVFAQTPQGFSFPAILRAHEKAAQGEKNEGREYTDDAEVWGEFVSPVAVIPGSRENRKITFPGDLPC
jgi:2-C-methyl-D-erythritol 4-phosphate cytidylyltransferase